MAPVTANAMSAPTGPALASAEPDPTRRPGPMTVRRLQREVSTSHRGRAECCGRAIEYLLPPIEIMTMWRVLSALLSSSAVHSSRSKGAVERVFSTSSASGEEGCDDGISLNAEPVCTVSDCDVVVATVCALGMDMLPVV